MVTLVTVPGAPREGMIWERNSSMKKLNFLVSLTNDDNDYQIEQATAVEEAARRLGVGLQVVAAANDSITQSQQILSAIQSRSEPRVDGIIFEPVGGTAMPQVARAAVLAGIGWVVLNRDADYIPELRKTYSTPCFAVTSDHEEIGRIQGRQFAALLPKGGSVLYIQGPAESLAAKQRTAGMYETKPADIQVKIMKGSWTETSAYRAVSSWLRLSTSHQTPVDAIAAQDDSMALGARKAFQELPIDDTRKRWLSLPFLGCDGLPKTGQAWIKRGLLTGSVFVPPNTDKALDMLVRAIQTTTQPPERNLTVPVSVPAIEELARTQAEKVRTLSAGAD